MQVSFIFSRSASDPVLAGFATGRRFQPSEVRSAVMSGVISAALVLGSCPPNDIT